MLETFRKLQRLNLLESFRDSAVMSCTSSLSVLSVEPSENVYSEPASCLLKCFPLKINPFMHLSLLTAVMLSCYKTQKQFQHLILTKYILFQALSFFYRKTTPRSFPGH